MALVLISKMVTRWPLSALLQLVSMLTFAVGSKHQLIVDDRHYDYGPLCLLLEMYKAVVNTLLKRIKEKRFGEFTDINITMQQSVKLLLMFGRVRR